MSVTRAAAPRCGFCCVHGQPYATVGWCGWCGDVESGHADYPADDEPMWLCPHGVGKDIWATSSPGSTDQAPGATPSPVADSPEMAAYQEASNELHYLTGD